MINSVGTTEKVLIVENTNKGIMGKTDSGRTIIITNTTNETKRFEKVKITKVENNQLYGIIVD